jgi:molecular chaperone GrpE
MENENETNPPIEPEVLDAQPDAPADPAVRITKLSEEKRELQDRLLRTAADFDNFRKRAEKDLKDAATRATQGVWKELLPVMDNLERALKHAAPTDAVAQGVRLVEKQMLSTLEKFGITRFESIGQPFDPAVHDAIQQVETASVPDGAVAEEFARGYLHNGKLLRPAMVAVAKSRPADDGSANN